MKKALMIMGTSSFAGKTLIVTGLCRMFYDEGFKVAPFKAQNMSLNSYSTDDGREISRGQALQCVAAKIECRYEMNPLLLKPKGDGQSQVMLNGKVFGDITAEDYYNYFVEEVGRRAVKEAFERLSSDFELIVMEGAGSPAEINLYEKDIANFGAADIADADVILVADIERGGAFASIYGTVMLLKPVHRKMIKGIIINKFRGNKKLLTPAIDKIQEMLGIPVIGIVPYISGLKLPEEDSQGLNPRSVNKADIVVIKLPKISNFTDFDPLTYSNNAEVRYISAADEIGSPDAIIIPGTKSVIDDLKWLKDTGLDEVVSGFKGKIPIIGICGGYQILGEKIKDMGVEKKSPSVYEGLGLLNVETTYESNQKTSKKVQGIITVSKGIFNGLDNASIEGYRIHMGKTKLKNAAYPIFTLDNQPEGAADREFMVFGTYLHGLFDTPSFRNNFIEFLLSSTKSKGDLSKKRAFEVWEDSIEKISNVLKRTSDMSWFHES